MSAEIEEQPVMVQPEPDDQIVETSKKSKISYTREFLLSLSEHEACRNLPDGFDESLLSEFDDASHGTQDRQRPYGSSSLQGFRRTDFVSSGPGRGDSGSYSKGIQRWDSRSSGRSDVDSDSESGRRFSNYTRNSGQNAEHDGLLGSGSFPRPSGYAAGASVPRFRPNGNSSLNRTNEPYQPPRPYKAAPHSRREITDSINDETFGSTDAASEDRVEEEKKRRAEFESMRKEQHRALQENQKSNLNKRDDCFSDITGGLGKTGDCKVSSDSDMLLKKPPMDDLSKPPVPSSASPSRPLVPPGFVNSVADKNSTAKSVVRGDQAGKMVPEESHRLMESVSMETSSNELLCKIPSLSTLKSGKPLDSPLVIQATEQSKTSNTSDINEILEKDDIIELDSGITKHKLSGEPGRSTSILDKLFGNAITTSSFSSDLVEGNDAKTEPVQSPNSLQSKFASWFLEEDKNQNMDSSTSSHSDKKRLEEVSPAKPDFLLSLIAGGEKGGSDVSDVLATGQILPAETKLGHMTNKVGPPTTEISAQYSSSNAPELKPAVLTCEDLEQSILSGIGRSISKSQPDRQENNALDLKTGSPVAVDNQASQHLLSLLQRGTESNDMASFLDKGSLDKPCDQGGVREMDAICDELSSGEVERVNNSGKTLTLEALFGTAFMTELHSANSVGSARTDVPEPAVSSFVTSDRVQFPSTNETGNGIGSDGNNFLMSVDGIGKLHRGNWSEFHNTERSKRPAEVDSNFGRFDVGIDVRLPEEDSLISLGDPINARNSIMPDSVTANTDMMPSSSNAPFNVMEKLATLGGAYKDDRFMAGQQMHAPYDMARPGLQYHNPHQQATSQHLHAPQTNQAKPMFHPSDSHHAHLDPHLKFMSPEAVIHRDLPMHHQLHTNMGHPPLAHHGGGVPSFDHPISSPILQQLHMGGNIPAPHLPRGYPGGVPIPHANHNNSAGYIQEHNPMQGFPFGQRQSNFGGPGMALPGPEIGGVNSPPEAFQRLLEMERRANPKQIMHPPFAGGHNRPMYGQELDMGFRYR